MSSPCKNCPFRTDLDHGYLGDARIEEIVDTLYVGRSFPCHETTVASEEEYGRLENDDTEQCAGAEIFLSHQGMSTQMNRIAHRLGFPVAELDMTSPVCRSLDEMLDVHAGELAK